MSNTKPGIFYPRPGKDLTDEYKNESYNDKGNEHRMHQENHVSHQHIKRGRFHTTKPGAILARELKIYLLLDILQR